MTYTKNQLIAALDLLRHRYPDEHWLWGKQRFFEALNAMSAYNVVAFPRREFRSSYSRNEIASMINELKHRS